MDEKRHLVWDWNGTLLDDFDLVIEATNASLAALGGPVVTAEEHRREFRRPVGEYYAAVLGRPVGQDDFTALDQVFHTHYRGGLMQCQLAWDAGAAMESWPGSQSLLSMWTHAELVVEIERRGLTGRFARIDGRIGSAGSDLKAEYLLAHLEALDIPGSQCVLIGDSVDDGDAAAAVGASCVLYSGGFTDVARLEETGWPVVASLAAAVRLARRPIRGAAPSEPLPQTPR